MWTYSIFMLSFIGNKYNRNNIRLYRDDGLVYKKYKQPTIWKN